MSLWSTILDIVFPIKCISCGERGADLCGKCLAESRGAERESAKWIFPIFDYRHPPIKKSIKLLKYYGKKRIADLFAEVMYGRIMEELSELSVMENFVEPILIPIPLSKKRHRERGYNQAELICKKLMGLDKNQNNLKFERNVLIKILEAKHQADIENRSLRLQNIVGSFSIKNMELIKDRNIILIDDVTTTGATLSEAKRTLKQYGVRKVVAFTVAH